MILEDNFYHLISNLKVFNLPSDRKFTICNNRRLGNTTKELKLKKSINFTATEISFLSIPCSLSYIRKRVLMV